MADLGSLTARIGLDATPLSAGLAAARGELTAFGDSGGGALATLSNIGRTAFLGLAAGAAVTGAASLKAASDFQASMELVRTQAGASQGEVDNMTKAILDMAGSLGTSPEQLAQGLFHIESAGFRGAQALDMLKIAAEGAKVGQADLESVTNALVAVEVSHIKGVGGVSDAMGILNAIVGVGNVRMGDLAKAMGTGILATAANFGLSMQDVGGALAVLTDNAVPADEAATRLRMTFSLMAAPSGRASDALKEIGLTSTQLADDMRTGGLIKAIGDLKTHLENSGKTATEQAAILSHAFGGGRTSSAILTLVSQFDRLKQKIGDVGAGAGTFADSWAATKETFKFQMDQMRASAEVLGIKIGTFLIPIVVSLVKALDSAVTWLSKHHDEALALAAVVGGPLLLAMGAFVATEIAAAAPVLLVGLAIGALSAAFVYAYEKIGPFHDAINALVSFFQTTFKTVVEDVQKVWQVFLHGFNDPGASFDTSTLVGKIGAFGQTVSRIIGDIRAGWQVFLRGFNDAGANFDTSTLQGKIGAFGQFVHSVLDGLGAGLRAFAGFITGTFIPAVGNAFTAIQGPLGDFVNYFRGIAPQVGDALMRVLNVIRAQVALIAGIFQAVFQVINGAWNLWGDQIIAIVRIVFDTVKIYIQTAIRIIRDVINIALALINGDWGQAWNALKDIPAAAFDLMKTIVGDGLKIIGNLFVIAWEGIVAGAQAGLGLLITFITSLPGLIINALGSFATLLFNTGMDLITGLFDGIKSVWGAVIGWFQALPGNIGANLADSPSWLIDVGKNAMQGFINGLSDLLPFLFTWFSRLPTKIKDSVGDALTWLKDKGKDTVQGFIDGMSDKVGDIKKWFTDLPDNVKLWTNKAIEWLKEHGKDTVQGFIDGMSEKVGEVIRWLREELPKKIKDAMSGAGEWLREWGPKLIKGFVTGIKEHAPEIGIALLVIPAALAALAIAIPATASLIAGAIVLGLITGLVKELPSFAKMVLVEIPQSLGQVTLSAGGWLLEAGVMLIKGLIKGLMIGMAAIGSWFASLPGIFAGFFSTAVSWLAETGNTIMTGLWNGIARGWGAISSWFAGLPGAIGSFFSTAVSWLAEAGNTILTGLWNGIARGWGAISSWFGGLPGAVGSFFSTAVSWLAEAGNTILTGLWNGIATGWSAITGWFSRLPGDIANAFITAGSWLINAGIDLIKGFLNGMIRALDLLPDIVKRFTRLDAVITGLHDAVNALDGAKVSVTAQANTAQAQTALDKLLATMNLLGNIPQGPPPSTYLPGPGAPNPLPLPPIFHALGGLTSGPSIAGESGQELILPMTDLRRARALLSQYGGPIVGGPGGAPGHMGQSTTHQYNINGNIVASDPMELERQLDTRARIAAMSGREQ